MKNRVITISREFGSGGRTIGKKVAEELKIPCYDSELLQKIADKTGFNEEYIKDAGEYASGGFLSAAFSHRTAVPTNADYLWKIQYDLITELAKKEPCVIVGRCADYILKDRADCLNVFVHADADIRAERIVRLYGESEKSPLKRLEEKDKKRSVYYRYYTGREWGMAANYHIALNSGKLGLERCVELIAELTDIQKALTS